MVSSREAEQSTPGRFTNLVLSNGAVVQDRMILDVVGHLVKVPMELQDMQVMYHVLSWVSPASLSHGLYIDQQLERKRSREQKLLSLYSHSQMRLYVDKTRCTMTTLF